MAKKTSPKLIGGFVIGAIALLIGGILAFGGGQYFSPKGKAVLFFEGSLAGLDVGSPVTFRGVKVGTVTGVVIQYDVTRQTLHIPVYIELDPERFEFVSGTRTRSTNNIKELVARGLRAQLQTVSLVTGQASVNFDFQPDTPIRLVNVRTDVLQLPTVPSDIEQLKATVSGVLAKVSKLPLEQLIAQLGDVLQNANQTLKGASTLVANVDAQVKPLSDSATKAANQASLTLQEAQKRLELREGEPMQNLNQTLTDARALMANLNSNMPQLVRAAGQVLKTANIALNQADTVLRTAQLSISPSSPVYFELVSTLREFKFAAAAVKVLAEYLQRNPSAMLTGNR
jgi:paraquat-inducible protein B